MERWMQIEAGGSKTGKNALPRSLDDPNPSAWEIVFAFKSAMTGDGDEDVHSSFFPRRITNERVR